MTADDDHPEPGFGSFSDLRVVELAGSPAGGYCGRLFAGLGAAVTLIIDPGDPPRSDDAQVRFLDRAKQLTASADPGALAAELRPDVVIESSAPGPLRARTRAAGLDPAVIRVELSPFGADGPYAAWLSTDLINDAIAGHARLNGSPDREPLRGPAHQAAYATGVFGFIGAIAALVARGRTGRGQTVEVTHHEVLAALHQFTLLRYTHNGDILRRMGNRYAGPGQPMGLYQCRDGAVSLVVPRDDQLDRLLAVTDLVHLLAEPGIESTYDLMHHPTLLDEHLRPWLAQQDARRVVELFQEVRVPASPVNTPLDLLEDRQLVHRGFWTPDGHDQSGGPPVRTPGPPFRLSRHRWGTGPDAEPGDPGAPAMSHRYPPRPATDDRSGGGPLEGIRILDLTRVWAGPLATRILADLGADVIRIEAPFGRGPSHVDQSSVMSTHYYPDNDPGIRHWNRIGFENKYGINKRSVALDLTHPGALAALEHLIAQADVLVENFSPRVMPQFGLSEARLHELNPALVYVTMPGYGRTGPDADRVAYGPMIDSHAGLSSLMGYAGTPGWKGGVAWPDPVAGIHAAAATLVALLDRAADPAGRGQTVELSQLEATVNMVGHAVVTAQLDGANPPIMGNRDPVYAPQGVYPAAGHDRWLALSVTSDDAWRALCHRAGWGSELADLDRPARRLRHDELDERIGRWTADFDPNGLAMALQSLGIAASTVADAAEVLDDPHLRHRGFFVDVDHPEAGRHPWPRLPLTLSDTPASIRRPAPTLGQHNHEVLTGLGGLSYAEFAALSDLGAVADHPPF